MVNIGTLKYSRNATDFTVTSADEWDCGELAAVYLCVYACVCVRMRACVYGQLKSYYL